MYTLSKMVKELIKKDDTLCYYQEVHSKWKEITDDYTAIISFKLINFCQILLNQIFLKPTVHKQQQ